LANWIRKKVKLVRVKIRRFFSFVDVFFIGC
jgi:hypothetical protein